MDLLLDPRTWAAFAAIVAIEAVLGVDNLVYLALLTEHQPQAHRANAERIGLGIAVGFRLALLGIILEIVDLTQPSFEILGQALSWRDIALAAGGIVLLVKGAQEIYGILEGVTGRIDDAPPVDVDPQAAPVINWMGIAQMAVIDATFATDSVASAFALSESGWVMLAGLLGGMGLLVWGAGPFSAFLTRHMSVRVLTFAFLLALGVSLLSDGLGYAIPKGIIAASMGLAAAVTALEILLHRKG